MSTSQFPNATIFVADQIDDLLTKLIQIPDPAVEADLELVVAAYLCAMAEHIINMRKLAQYHQLDPTIVAQLKTLIDSCR